MSGMARAWRLRTQVCARACIDAQRRTHTSHAHTHTHTFAPTTHAPTPRINARTSSVTASVRHMHSSASALDGARRRTHGGSGALPASTPRPPHAHTHAHTRTHTHAQAREGIHTESGTTPRNVFTLRDEAWLSALIEKYPALTTGEGALPNERDIIDFLRSHTRTHTGALAATANALIAAGRMNDNMATHVLWAIHHAAVKHRVRNRHLFSAAQATLDCVLSRTQARTDTHLSEIPIAKFARVLGAYGKVDDAIATTSMLTTRGLWPSVFFFNDLMKAALEARAHTRAIQVYATLSDFDHAPHISTRKILLYALRQLLRREAGAASADTSATLDEYLRLVLGARNQKEHPDAQAEVLMLGLQLLVSHAQHDVGGEKFAALWARDIALSRLRALLPPHVVMEVVRQGDEQFNKVSELFVSASLDARRARQRQARLASAARARIDSAHTASLKADRGDTHDHSKADGDADAAASPATTSHAAAAVAETLRRNLSTSDDASAAAIQAAFTHGKVDELVNARAAELLQAVLQKVDETGVRSGAERRRTDAGTASLPAQDPSLLVDRAAIIITTMKDMVVAPSLDVLGLYIRAVVTAGLPHKLKLLNGAMEGTPAGTVSTFLGGIFRDLAQNKRSGAVLRSLPYLASLGIRPSATDVSDISMQATKEWASLQQSAHVSCPSCLPEPSRKSTHVTPKQARPGSPEDVMTTHARSSTPASSVVADVETAEVVAQAAEPPPGALAHARAASAGEGGPSTNTEAVLASASAAGAASAPVASTSRLWAAAAARRRHSNRASSKGATALGTTTSAAAITARAASSHFRTITTCISGVRATVNLTPPATPASALSATAAELERAAAPACEAFLTVEPPSESAGHPLMPLGQLSSCLQRVPRSEQAVVVPAPTFEAVPRPRAHHVNDAWSSLLHSSFAPGIRTSPALKAACTGITNVIFPFRQQNRHFSNSALHLSGALPHSRRGRSAAEEFVRRREEMLRVLAQERARPSDESVPMSVNTVACRGRHLFADSSPDDVATFPSQQVKLLREIGMMGAMSDEALLTMLVESLRVGCASECWSVWSAMRSEGRDIALHPAVLRLVLHAVAQGGLAIPAWEVYTLLHPARRGPLPSLHALAAADHPEVAAVRESASAADAVEWITHLLNTHPPSTPAVHEAMPLPEATRVTGAPPTSAAAPTTSTALLSESSAAQVKTRDTELPSRAADSTLITPQPARSDELPPTGRAAPQDDDLRDASGRKLHVFFREPLLTLQVPKDAPDLDNLPMALSKPLYTTGLRCLNSAEHFDSTLCLLRMGPEDVLVEPLSGGMSARRVQAVRMHDATAPRSGGAYRDAALVCVRGVSRLQYRPPGYGVTIEKRVKEAREHVLQSAHSVALVLDNGSTVHARLVAEEPKAFLRQALDALRSRTPLAPEMDEAASKELEKRREAAAAAAAAKQALKAERRRVQEENSRRKQEKKALAASHRDAASEARVPVVA